MIQMVAMKKKKQYSRELVLFYEARVISHECAVGCASASSRKDLNAFPELYQDIDDCTVFVSRVC